MSTVFLQFYLYLKNFCFEIRTREGLNFWEKKKTGKSSRPLNLGANSFTFLWKPGTDQSELNMFSFIILEFELGKSGWRARTLPT